MSIELYHRNGRQANEREVARAKPTRRADTFYYPDQLPCGRCGGAGGSEAWRYTGWTCYDCGGHGRGRIVEVKLYTRERLDFLEAQAEKKAAKKRAEVARKAEKKRQEFIAWAKEGGRDRGALLGRILRTGKLRKNDFITDLAGKLRQRWTLSEKQLDAADRVIDGMEKREAERGTSKWVGDIKDRVELEALVIGVYQTDGFYGVIDIVKMKTPEGNMLTWFNSGREVMHRGDRVRIKGTVKKHDEYRGEKQTVLTRCNVIERFETMTADEAAQAEEIS